MGKAKINRGIYRVLSLGAGVQSTALSYLFQNKKLENPPDCAIFADTKNEPKAVYKQLKRLKKDITVFPIYIVTSKLINLALNPGKIPLFIKNKETGKIGMGWRQCTNDYKIKVVDRKIKELLKYPPRARMKHHIQLILGMSTDELQRLKEAKEAWKTLRYPLVDEVNYSRIDCLNYIDSLKLPAPPKSACVFCPYRSASGWKPVSYTHLTLPTICSV